MNRIVSTASGSIRAIEDYVLVTVLCTIFDNGDPTEAKGSLLAKTFIASESARASGLQPSLRYLLSVAYGAISQGLSRPYCSHLFSLRPLEHSTKLKRLGKKVFTLCLLPPFLFLYLPSQLLAGRLPRSVSRITRFPSYAVWWCAHIAEKCWSNLLGGSGYRNDHVDTKR